MADLEEENQQLTSTFQSVFPTLIAKLVCFSLQEPWSVMVLTISSSSSSYPSKPFCQSEVSSSWLAPALQYPSRCKEECWWCRDRGNQSPFPLHSPPYQIEESKWFLSVPVCDVNCPRDQQEGKRKCFDTQEMLTHISTSCILKPILLKYNRPKPPRYVPVRWQDMGRSQKPCACEQLLSTCSGRDMDLSLWQPKCPTEDSSWMPRLTLCLLHEMSVTSPMYNQTLPRYPQCDAQWLAVWNTSCKLNSLLWLSHKGYIHVSMP